MFKTLLQRVCALCVQNDLQATSIEPDPLLDRVAAEAKSRVAAAVCAFALQDALRAIFEFVGAANRYADSTAPWHLAKLRREATNEAEVERTNGALQRSLASLVEALRVSADLLEPFLPSTARSVRARLVPHPSLAEPLFPSLRGFMTARHVCARGASPRVNRAHCSRPCGFIVVADCPCS